MTIESLNLTTRRGWLVFAGLALILSFVFTRGLVAAPAFTDAFYHFNAANRLVTGQGLTDPYLWTYIGAPASLPAPSHLYWMPMTSLLAALGMVVFNAPGSYAAAQVPFALLFAATGLIGFYLGAVLGHSRRHAWMAGLLTIFSGFFVRYWGAMDTFAPYACFGALTLCTLGYLTPRVASPVNRVSILLALAGGAGSALAHLTRADGLLLLLVGWLIIVWPVVWGTNDRFVRRLSIAIPHFVLMTLAYLLVMLPWGLRNLSLIGTPLPLGGSQAIWFTSYDDIFNYPPDSSIASFFAAGPGLFLSTRWQAFTANATTFIAVEGLVVMAPLMVIAIWRRRSQPFLRAFWLYAISVHLVMTLVFPFPGYRGGLFHSAAALVPWWAVLGLLGLDDVIAWISRRRRAWDPILARRIFSAALLVVAVLLTLLTALPNRVVPRGTPALYRRLSEMLPVDARVMVNDPAQLYYFTGRGGVVLPNAEPPIILDIARRFGVDYLLIEEIAPDGRSSNALPVPLWPVLTDPPVFLKLLSFDEPGVRLYEIIQ